MEKLTKDKEHLVLDNLNMVHYVLQKQLHTPIGHSNYEDYYQEGVVGLILSAIRFDESKGFKFSTFAFPNILGTIQRYKRENEAAVKIPRSLKDVLFKVMKYQSQGYSYEDIEQIEGITQHQIFDALNTVNAVSLEQEIASEDSSLTLQDTIADERNYLEETLAEGHILYCIQSVSDSIKNEIHKAIWEEYIYGLLYGEKLGPTYLSRKYNISQTYVTRLLQKYKKQFQQILIGG